MNAIIYALAEPGGSVRYVGKTTDVRDRVRRHLRDARKGAQTRCARWLRTLLAAGLEPEVRVLEAVEGPWPAAERRWIEHYRAAGADLCNLTAGGEGGPTRLGARNTAAHKAAIGAAHRGRRRSVEARQRMAAVHRNARKTHCPQGHLYDESNTYTWKGRPGRLCRQCRRDADLRRRARNAMVPVAGT